MVDADDSFPPEHFLEPKEKGRKIEKSGKKKQDLDLTLTEYHDVSNWGVPNASQVLDYQPSARLI